MGRVASVMALDSSGHKTTIDSCTTNVSSVQVSIVLFSISTLNKLPDAAQDRVVFSVLCEGKAVSVFINEEPQTDVSLRVRRLISLFFFLLFHFCFFLTRFF